jgi:hypothetical protein
MYEPRSAFVWLMRITQIAGHGLSSTVAFSVTLGLMDERALAVVVGVLIFLLAVAIGVPSLWSSHRQRLSAMGVYVIGIACVELTWAFHSGNHVREGVGKLTGTIVVVTQLEGVALAFIVLVGFHAALHALPIPVYWGLNKSTGLHGRRNSGRRKGARKNR